VLLGRDKQERGNRIEERKKQGVENHKTKKKKEIKIDSEANGDSKTQVNR
jgi:hypothetical protein